MGGSLYKFSVSASKEVKTGCLDQFVWWCFALKCIQQIINWSEHQHKSDWSGVYTRYNLLILIACALKFILMCEESTLS